MSTSDANQAADLSPEAVLARATKARGDIFPEWKPVAYAIPKTYHLINETVSYLHQYQGQAESSGGLSAQMRELIAIPALCAKGDMRHAPNHVRRAYRLGLTDKALFEAATAYAVVTGWASSILQMSLTITEAKNPAYPFGQLPPGGEPQELVPFPEMKMGRTLKNKDGKAPAQAPEWHYAATIDPEFARRATAWVDHCLLDDAAHDVLGPGPRALIAIAALCTRGEVELAANHVRRAYDYGMTKRNVLEAICCVIPMTGMITAQLGLRAMQLADSVTFAASRP